MYACVFVYVVIYVCVRIQNKKTTILFIYILRMLLL